MCILQLTVVGPQGITIIHWLQTITGDSSTLRANSVIPRSRAYRSTPAAVPSRSRSALAPGKGSPSVVASLSLEEMVVVNE
ncbi:hypothetical protein BDV93DRAFT_529834 [Ceratobasidium sp. AG-I]|nr:hypothetical protein BDV93DRAFT_529834 [Ceratobasidium sp. AG-I]